MKINVENWNTDTGSVKAGECFWYKGLLYMRIKPIIENENYVHAVLLSTGNVAEFMPDTQVELANCMVVKNELL